MREKAVMPGEAPVIALQNFQPQQAGKLFLCTGKHTSNNIIKYTPLSPNDNGRSD